MAKALVEPIVDLVEQGGAGQSAVALRTGGWVDTGQQLAALPLREERLESHVNPLPILRD